MRKSAYHRIGLGLGLGIVFILLISMSAAASTVVVKGIGSGVDPVIDGSKIAWARVDGKEIRSYDLATQKYLTIKTSLACYPDISSSSNTLVWCGNGKAPRLTVYDMGTKKSRYIPLGEAWVKPSISSDKIVWSAKGRINVYDISTGQQSFVANGYNPDISGSRIAYEAVDGAGQHDIAIYDITSKTIMTVPHDGDLTGPKISGDYVIFTDNMGNIAQYVIANGEYKVINENNVPGHSDEGELNSYALQGPVIVYAKSHNNMMGQAGVYLYDSGTGELQWLRANGDQTGSTMAISGDSTGMNVVWGFVPSTAENAKKVNGGIYLSPYIRTENTGPLDINTWRDGAKADVYSSAGNLVVSASGSTIHENLSFGEYMVILSGMGNPATRVMSFNMTGDGIYMDFPV